MGNNVPHIAFVRLTSYYLFLSSIKVHDLYNEEVTCIPPTVHTTTRLLIQSYSDVEKPFCCNRQIRKQKRFFIVREGSEYLAASMT